MAKKNKEIVTGYKEPANPADEYTPLDPITGLTGKAGDKFNRSVSLSYGAAGSGYKDLSVFSPSSSVGTGDSQKI